MIKISLEMSQLVRDCQAKAKDADRGHKMEAVIREAVRQVSRRLLLLPTDEVGETISVEVVDRLDDFPPEYVDLGPRDEDGNHG